MSWRKRRSDRLGDETRKQLGPKSREIWGRLWLERLWQDLRYALRGFGKSPGFTAIALLSLTLGVGASTALFSVVYGVLIAPYPYAKANEIWAPTVLGPKESPRGWHTYSVREFLDIQKVPAFSDVMATSYEPVLLTGESSPERFYGVLVSGGGFKFLGVRPLIGRTIQPFDIRLDGTAAPVVVLTYQFWQREFNGNEHAIGSKLMLNDVPYTVIGVMPPRFGWYTNESFWLPLPMTLADQPDLNVIVRFRPGISKEAAAQQLQQLNVRLAQEDPKHFPKGGFRTGFLNYMDITVASGEMSSSLHLLLAAVGFLLLIACVNVANLQLARTTTRAREIAVRLSIGAGRLRLIRQLLTESVLLAVLGGALGVLFAIGATHAIAAFIPSNYVPNEARITINGHVLLFSLVVSVLTGILFGLTPALRCSRPNLVDTLKDGGKGASGSIHGQRMRTLLVVAEVALSVILLSGASLAIRSFASLLSIDPGFQPQKTLLVEMPLPPKRYATLERRNVFDRNLLDSLRNLPGVEAAAIGNGGMPFGGPRSPYSVEGQSRVEDRRIVLSLISSGYPRTLGIPLKRGRVLTESEVANGSHVALINETAAKLWPAGEDPIGRQISVDLLANPGSPNLLVPAANKPEVTVVGILADTKNAGLREGTLPGVYVPYTLMAPPTRVLAVRTFGQPDTILNAVRQKVRALDKDLPLGRAITLKDVLGFQTVQPRFTMALFACFAGLGLSLAAIGIYCVISYDVTQRMHEIGVRLALGATRRNVLAMVLRMAAKLALLGLGIGLCGSLLLERIARFQVFAATGFDALSCAAVAIVLSVVALAASWWPARRAGALDPVAALRHEA